MAEAPAVKRGTSSSAEPSGTGRWEIVKNFPTEEEVAEQLAGLARPLSYREYPGRSILDADLPYRGNREQVARADGYGGMALARGLGNSPDACAPPPPAAA